MITVRCTHTCCFKLESSVHWTSYSVWLQERIQPLISNSYWLQSALRLKKLMGRTGVMSTETLHSNNKSPCGRSTKTTLCRLHVNLLPSLLLCFRFVSRHSPSQLWVRNPSSLECFDCAYKTIKNEVRRQIVDYFPYLLKLCRCAAPAQLPAWQSSTRMGPQRGPWNQKVGCEACFLIITSALETNKIGLRSSSIIPYSGDCLPWTL